MNNKCKTKAIDNDHSMDCDHSQRQSKEERRERERVDSRKRTKLSKNKCSKYYNSVHHSMKKNFA